MIKFYQHKEFGECKPNVKEQRSDLSVSKDIKELIQSFEKWISFTQSMQKLPEEIWDSSLEEGKWTVRDIVSHMMLWDKYFKARILYGMIYITWTH
jgi:uncharacterized damage-inducible protein DinB